MVRPFPPAVSSLAFRRVIRLVHSNISRPTSAASAASAVSAAPSLKLESNQTITEGPSWVTISPPHLSETPRHRSQLLRAAGEYRQAHAVLRRAGIAHTRSQEDLIEYLQVLQHTDEFSGPHQRLQAMLGAIWAAPIRKSKKAFRVVLNTCAYEAANVSDNAVLKMAAVERATGIVWQEMRQFRRSIDTNTIAFIYRICGLCRALDLAQRIRDDVNDPNISSNSANVNGASSTSEDTLAEYILCLGKCGKPVDAERVFFVQENRQFRASPRVLASLFQAYLAASRISKAEALISMNGASFLDLSSCNAFIRQCASLRLFDTAIAFLDQMERSHETGFPSPVARTYNILLHGISSTHAAAEENFEQTTQKIIMRMKAQNIYPTTVTYNTLIRSFVYRSKMDDAMLLFKAMHSPDRITFSHLMQGAASSTDATVAEELLEALQRFDVRPTYGFCKSYLHVMAAAYDVEHAYAQAHELVEKFGDVLVFGDVGAEEAIRMALIHACGKVGDLPAAFRALAAKFGNGNLDGGPLAPLYVATVLMQACLDCGKEGQALEVFESLKSSGLEPNFEVYESLIKGLCEYVRDSVNMINQGLEDERDLALRYSADGLRDVGLLHVPEHGEAEEVEEDLELNRLDNAQAYDRNDEIIDYDTHGMMTSMPSSTSGDDVMHVFDETLKLMREMHEGGAARTTRHAGSVYNVLIAAAAGVGRFELALEIFRRMTQHSNTKVLYVVGEHSEKSGGADEEEWSELKGWKEVPAATVNTYNAMMAAAWRSGRAEAALMIFNRMQMDRETEPNMATLGLLADIGLDCSDAAVVQSILSELDRVRVGKRISKKRVQLRQKMLALRWSK